MTIKMQLKIWRYFAKLAEYLVKWQKMAENVKLWEKLKKSKNQVIFPLASIFRISTILSLSTK
jgi:hypothetical protein